jgi:hypothetical protein
MQLQSLQHCLQHQSLHLMQHLSLLHSLQHQRLQHSLQHRQQHHSTCSRHHPRRPSLLLLQQHPSKSNQSPQLTKLAAVVLAGRAD